MLENLLKFFFSHCFITVRGERELWQRFWIASLLEGKAVKPFLKPVRYLFIFLLFYSIRCLFNYLVSRRKEGTHAFRKWGSRFEKLVEWTKKKGEGHYQTKSWCHFCSDAKFKSLCPFYEIFIRLLHCNFFVRIDCTTFIMFPGWLGINGGRLDCRHQANSRFYKNFHPNH